MFNFKIIWHWLLGYIGGSWRYFEGTLEYIEGPREFLVIFLGYFVGTFGIV
jgi:hypothetical protein